MDKLKMHSPNKVDENIEKIGALFPNCLTEVKNEDGEVVRAIDFDMLRQELSSVIVEGNEERYQFTWPDKKKSILLANAPISETLRPCREESVDFDNTENLYIEGDNLDVLKLLQETYLGKIKMIYIDPPYNTGNDSFVYDDDFAISESLFAKMNGNIDDDGNILYSLQVNNDANGRFHTDWINMIYPRIRLSKNLLCDDGVLFISIDNNEISNMKRICDEIFGESCFVTILHVQMSTVQGQKVRAAKAGNIVKNGEHILVYSKGTNKAIGTHPLLDPVKYDNHYNKILVEKANGSFLEENLTDVIEKNTAIKNELQLLGLLSSTSEHLSSTRIQDYYELSPLFRQFVNANAETVVRAHDSVDVPKSFLEKMEIGVVYKYESENRSYLVCKNEKGVVTQRISLAEKIMQADDFYKTFGPTTIRGDWWSGFYLDMGNVSKEGGVNYDNGKKPVRLLSQLIDFCTADGDIVLDFFSGSATTAHAVMQLASDGKGNRRFIMIQLNEDLDKSLENATATNKASIKSTIKFLDEIHRPHILSEVGKERIRRVGQAIGPATLFGGESDIGFRVLKLDSSNMKDVYYNPAEYTPTMFDTLADNIKEDRSPEDLLFQVMLDLGVLLSSKIEESTIAGKKVFNVADGFLIACFDANVTDEVITEIAKKKPYYFVMRDNSMASDSVATNFEQIFATYSPDTVRKVL